MTTLKFNPFLTGSVLALFISISSCKKDEKVSTITAEATIINTGSVALDGCDWAVKINATDSTYSPKNLADNFKVNGLKVNVSFQVLTTRFPCGSIANFGLRQIQISQISADK